MYTCFRREHCVSPPRVLESQRYTGSRIGITRNNAGASHGCDFPYERDREDCVRS